MKREARYDYAAAIATRYQRSSREHKGWTLDEFCTATGYNRKYAIKLLRGPFPRAALPQGHGRPPMYGREHAALLRTCWELSCCHLLVRCWRWWRLSDFQMNSQPYRT